MLDSGFSRLEINEEHTLRQGLETLNQKLKELNQSNNPNQNFLTKLIERPNRIIDLPSQIDLFSHDCMHVLLGIGTYMHDEAFIVGFTMGNSTRINPFHKYLYKFVSNNLYPKEYGLNHAELKIFDSGYKYGKSLPKRDIHHIDFLLYLEEKVSVLREKFNIFHYEQALNFYLQSTGINNIPMRVSDTLE